MERPRIRLGNKNAWVELAQTGEDDWRISADWCSLLKADFAAWLSREEAVGFATRMLAQLDASSGARFAVAVTPGRNNPLTLNADPVGDGYAFYAWLTPNGDDEAAHLQLDMNPVPTAELRDVFRTFRASLLR
ncbi:hypothetical protein GCM10018781_56970 [Kitasatospora indigofera]|uniref:Uncharacterized protein n=2 Tax=Kitasatospora indigofera TaxID=67307 RepID=A0A919L0T7_9ACTN|nr:hypothetical protein GCM10018781_56970 [Kitasatospora indigofera]